MLVNTQEAARLTGLSAYELRTGFKRGIYPALEIGRGDRRRSLRWNPEVLERALEARMRAGTVSDDGE